MQGRRNRQRGYRGCRQHRRQAVFLTDVFQHCLGQFLDEQRHAIGALDDLGDDLAAERRVAGDAENQRANLPTAEPVQREARHMRLAAPRRLKLRPKGDDQQHRQVLDPLDHQIEQFA